MNHPLIPLKNLALSALFPRGALCLCCATPAGVDEESGLCEACTQRLEGLRLREDVCPRCMAPMERTGYCPFCLKEGMKGLDRAYGAYRYQGEARQLIRLLKFSWQNEPVTALAEGMLQVFAPGDWDALVPVPLHPRRQRVRGANQALLLCEELSLRCGMEVCCALERRVYTRAQSSLGREKRLRNIQNAFRLREGVQVKGRRLLLVDDVRTTGATGRECARVLRRAGAARVGLLTAAIA